jgi:DNA repair/transcription protein MET18/MMS19
MPSLLRGVGLADEDMRASVINTLISVAEEQSAGEGDIISEHASTIIAALLRNADYHVTPNSVSPHLFKTSCMS